MYTTVSRHELLHSVVTEKKHFETELENLHLFNFLPHFSYGLVILELFPVYFAMCTNVKLLYSVGNKSCMMEICFVYFLCKRVCYWYHLCYKTTVKQLQIH